MPLTPLLLLLLSLAVFATSAPHKASQVTSNDFSNDVSVPEAYNLDSKSTEEVVVMTPELVMLQKLPKTARMHKSIIVNYPYMQKYNQDPADDYNLESRKPNHRNRLSESKIFFVRLPPTPYFFVPGLGYISNPPTFSTSNLKPHKKTGNRGGQHPFIKLPIDFVSNGKPSFVYHFEKQNKRPDSSLTKFTKGPYNFNGRPSSLYILSPDGKPTMHQPIKYSKSRGNNIW